MTTLDTKWHYHLATRYATCKGGRDNLGNAKKKGFFSSIPSLLSNPEDMSNWQKAGNFGDLGVLLHTLADNSSRRMALAVVTTASPDLKCSQHNLPQISKDLTLNWYLLRHPAKASIYLEDRIMHSHLQDICDPKTNHPDKARWNFSWFLPQALPYLSSFSWHHLPQ